MRKVFASTFVSLDGVMQAPGGPDEDPTGGFKFGGWIWTYSDDAIAEAMAEVFGRPFDLLLGRKTHDIFAAYWPYVQADPNDFSQIARAFGDAAPPMALKLTQTKASPSGVIIASYQRDGAVKTGSYGDDTPSQAELERRRNLT